MTNVVLKLLGLRDSGNIVRASLELRGIGMIPWVLLLGAMLGLIVWITYRRTTGDASTSRRAILAGLRGAFLFLLLLMVLRPVLQLTIDATTRRQLICLFDFSAIMS